MMAHIARSLRELLERGRATVERTGHTQGRRVF
jgi:hypothetical protein